MEAAQKTVRDALTGLIDREYEGTDEREAKVWRNAQAAQEQFRDTHDEVTRRLQKFMAADQWGSFERLVEAEFHALLWTLAVEKSMEVALRRATDALKYESVSTSAMSNTMAASQRSAARKFLNKVTWWGDLTEREHKILALMWV